MSLLSRRWPHHLLSKLDPSQRSRWETEHTMNNSQTLYRNRALTYTLPHRSQEASLLSTSCQVHRTSDCYSSKQSRRPNNKSCNNWPQMARTPLITDSFPGFCPHFQFEDPPEKAKAMPLASYIGHPASSQPSCSFPRPTASSQGPPEAAPGTELGDSSACLRASPERKWWWWPPLLWWALNSLCLFSFVWFSFISTNYYTTNNYAALRGKNQDYSESELDHPNYKAPPRKKSGKEVWRAEGEMYHYR